MIVTYAIAWHHKGAEQEPSPSQQVVSQKQLSQRGEYEEAELSLGLIEVEVVNVRDGLVECVHGEVAA